MQGIFISYRRDDSEGHAGRLFEDLVEHFGRDAVFMDVADIQPGRDFRKVIDSQVASCGVLLAIIGKRWLESEDESGRRRLDDPADFVRLETASALKRDIPVIPVLVQGARMPAAAEIPDDLKDLAFRNAVELTHARWESDVQVLIGALRDLFPSESQARVAPEAGRQEVETEASRAPAPETQGRATPRASGMAVSGGGERDPKGAPRWPRAVGLGAAVVAVGGGLWFYGQQKAGLAPEVPAKITQAPAEPAKAEQVPTAAAREPGPPPAEIQPATPVAATRPAVEAVPPSPEARDSAASLGAALVGRYLVQGTNPNGTPYAGRAAIQALGNEHFEVTWTIGGQRYKGLGTFEAQSRTLDVAADTGPVSYRLLDDGSLSGRWAKGRATETLRRAPGGAPDR